MRGSLRSLFLLSVVFLVTGALILRSWLVQPTIPNQPIIPKDAIVVNLVTEIPTMNGTISTPGWRGASHYFSQMTIANGLGRQLQYYVDFYLGHTFSVIYLGFIIHNAGLNPNDNANSSYSDSIGIFFKVSNGSKLSQPEASRYIGIGVLNQPAGWVAWQGVNNGFFDGIGWEGNVASWLGSPPCGPQNLPKTDYAAYNASYDNTTGTEILEAGFHLDSQDECNARDALHLKPGSFYLLDFILFYLRAGPDNYHGFFGSWPNKEDWQSSLGPIDLTQYAKLAIDLKALSVSTLSQQEMILLIPLALLPRPNHKDRR